MNKPIQRLFSQIPDTYELANLVLTFGLDKLWRKEAARVASAGAGETWLDIASGTGQMAASLAREKKENTKIIAVDFCIQMLRENIKKLKDKNISLCIADAQELPFKDNTFDLATISFATRNINTSRRDLVGCFSEFRRVIKPKARFINLETSQPIFGFLRKLFHFYVELVVKPLGYLISGSKTAYAYLAYTCPRFFSAEELAEILYKSGFANVSFSRMTLGITAIHIATK